MQELAQIMRKLRFQKGSIDFEVGEAEIRAKRCGKAGGNPCEETAHCGKNDRRIYGDLQ